MKNKLRIGLVFDDSLDSNDGVQQYVKTLGRWLIWRGHEVRFLVGETHNAGDLQKYVYSLSRNIRISGNQNKMFLPWTSSSKKINQALEKEKFDVLHVMMPTNPLMGSRVIRRAQVPVVGTFHMVGGTWFINIGATLLRLVQTRTLAKIDRFLSVSEAARAFELKHFKRDSTVSPNMVNMTHFAAGNRQEFMRGKNGTIVFLGRLVERKGVQHLLHALRILHQDKRLQGVLIHICGDGELREELESFVRDHQLQQNVQFHGFIDEAEKSDFLASADIAVFPATGGEAFGIVLIEAMATGQCVVLGGENDGYKTVLGGRQQLLFDPSDHASLANMIDHFLSDESARRDAVSWQKKEVQKYDVSVVGKQIEGIYYEVLNRSS